MAIKHIKNIQSKSEGAESATVGATAAARQCFQVDQYREGYHECLTTAVQFLIEVSAHFEDICFKMVNHLREHFNDVVKGENCPNSSTNGRVTLAMNLQQQIKRRQQDNGSPLSTVNGISPFLLSNGGSGGGGGNDGALVGSASAVASSTLPTGNGTGPRVAHLCGSINGYSSSARSQGTCEGMPSSSDGQEMNCAKDLSCRGANHQTNGSSQATTSTAAQACGKAPQQTPVITSTACSTSLQSSSSVNADLLVNVETESSSSALDHDHGCLMEETVPRSATDHEEDGVAGASTAGGQLVKVHNLTETSCDGVEHHYKYKNYMQQRFSHEKYHDEHVVSNSSNELHDLHDHPISACQVKSSRGNADAGSTNGDRVGNMAPPPEPTDSNCSVDTFVAFNAKRAALDGLKLSGDVKSRDELMRLALLHRDCDPANIKEEKMDTSSSCGASEVLVGSRMIEGNQQLPRSKTKGRSSAVPVPIFALHSQGFYVPLRVDYEVLVPFLGDMNVLEKNLTTMKALHPVSINIYTPI